jgi:hypothetical protein
VISKEACSQDKCVMSGIGTGQREESCEALLLSASVHDRGSSDTSYGSNRSGEGASVCLLVALCVNTLTIEDGLLLGHKIGV